MLGRLGSMGVAGVTGTGAENCMRPQPLKDDAVHAQQFSNRFASPGEIAARITELVTLPAVYLEVRKVVNDEDASASDLARVVSADPAIAARVLRVVNSAAYRPVNPVETISQAVSILGMRRVHDLALASSLASMFEKLPMADASMAGYWARAVTTALMARKFALAAQRGDAEAAFVQGLFAEVGHLAMFQAAPECVRAVLERATLVDRDVAHVEYDVLGFHHAEVGAELLSLWSLPDALVSTVATHALPNDCESTSFDALVCHIAWHAAAAVGSDETIEQRLTKVAPFVFTRLGVDAGAFALEAESAVEEAEELHALFFPPLAKEA